MHLVLGHWRVALACALAAVVAVATCSPIGVAADAGASVGSDGLITAFAGTGLAGAGGDGGPALAARMSSPGDVAVGGGGAVFVADTGNHRVRRIDPDGTITVVAGTGVAGSGADGVPATEAALNLPAAVALDADGNLYVVDTGNHRIRRVGPDGRIRTVAGTGLGAFSGDGGPAVAADLRSPGGLTFGPDGSLYVADSLNHRVRRIDHDGTIGTVAGTGAVASAGDGGAATSAAMNLPRGLAFDDLGRLYIAESGGHRLRRVAGDGTITTSAGTGTRGFAGDGGPAKQALLSEPRDVDVDGAGKVYISDSANHRIRLLMPDGMIHTTAGIGDAGDEGDQGPAVWAEVDAPRGLGLDPLGNLLIADTRNHRVRLVTRPVPAPPGTGVGQVQPTVETDPMGGTVDAADDPAIWAHPTDPAKSLLIGTDKYADVLEVYDLTTGDLLQQLPDATAWLNNVDVRTGFTLAGQVVDLVVTSGADLAVYKVDVAARRLVDVTARRIRPAYGAQGVCLYSNHGTGKLYAFSTIGSGHMEQFELFDNAGKVDARSVRGPWDVNPANPVVEDGEIEACAADDETGQLYVSEQDVGIWKYGAEPDDGTGAEDRSLVAGTTWHNGGLLAPDVEGLAIVPQPGGGGWLIASSQGDDTFVIYERAEPHTFVRKFRTVNGVVDACTHTDGIDALAAPLGAAFPAGVFVCQDNSDTLPGTNGNQSFKVIPLDRVVPFGAPGPGPTPTTTTTIPTTTTTTTPIPTTTTTTTTTPIPTTTTTTTSTTTTTTTTTAAPATTTTTTKPVTTTTTPARPDPVVSEAGADDRSPVAPSLAGYWMLGGDGAVYPFGDARHHGAMRLSAGATAADIEPTPTGRGYWILDDKGTLTAHGDARPLAAARFPTGERATAVSATPSGRGAWVFSDRGRVVALGDATFRGDLSGKTLNGPVLDSIATPTGNGYYMVASDGGIFAFGDAAFHGSMGGVRLNAPVQSLVPDPDGSGYWLVASDGGVFAFDAGFRGSMGGRPLNRPVTGMVAYGDGYLMVAEDGGIFSFSNRAFVGSLAASPPAVPIHSVAALPAHR